MIRRATLADAAQICTVYNPFITDTTISFESAPLSVRDMEMRIAEVSEHSPYLVYEEEGKISGFCYAHPWKVRIAYSPTMETSVYVTPEAQGRGIGRLLMERLIDECRRLPAHSLIACITADNSKSIDFHTSLGFRQASYFSEVGRKFGRWLDVVDMQLML